MEEGCGGRGRVWREGEGVWIGRGGCVDREGGEGVEGGEWCDGSIG